MRHYPDAFAVWKCRRRTWLAGAICAIAAALVASSANAGIGAPPQIQDDFEVSGDVSKLKSTLITEAIFRNKDIRLDVVTMFPAAKMTEALAVLNQNNGTDLRNGELPPDTLLLETDNQTESYLFGPAIISGQDNSRTSSLLGAGSDNAGITVVNQTSGNLNNQASNIAGAAVSNVVFLPDGSFGFTEAQAAGQQDNSMLLFSSSVNDIVAAIDTSLNNNVGVLHASQASGSINNQGNALAISLDMAGGGVAMTDSALGQINSWVAVQNFAIARQADMIASVNGNNGVVGVNQAAGTFGNQANLVALGVGYAGN